MITPSEQQRTIERLEWLTHAASHLLLALALTALLLAHWPSLLALLLLCAAIGSAVGWRQREHVNALWWCVIGAGVIITLVLTALQTQNTPLTFDGVLGLLGRMLAGLAACQAFERASTRASALRHAIAIMLLAVAAMTVLRGQLLWSMGSLVLCLALWVFARRGALLLDKLRQQPLTLVNFLPRDYRWTGQAGSAAVALCLIGACAGATFWVTPQVPLPSIPFLKGPFGTLGSSTGTSPNLEDKSSTGYTNYLNEEFTETLKEIGTARNLSELDQLAQRAGGILAFLEQEGKVEAIQLELLRKFSQNLNKRQVRRLAQQEERQRRSPQPPQPSSLSPHEQHAQEFQEELQFLGEVQPRAADELQQLAQQLAGSVNAGEAQQVQERMERAAAALPQPFNVETPELQRLIAQLMYDWQQMRNATDALMSADTDVLREQFQQAVQTFGGALQRQLRQQPPDAGWQQHTQALLASTTDVQGFQEAFALTQQLAQATDRQQLTPEQSSALAQQLDLAAELRMEIDHPELRPPDLARPGRLPKRMTLTAQKLAEALQRAGEAPAGSRQARQAAADVQLLQAQQALQQAGHAAQQAAGPLSGQTGHAVRQAVAGLARAVNAAQARQAATQLQQALESVTQDQAAAKVRQAASELLQQQIRSSRSRSLVRLYLGVPGEPQLFGRPYLFFAIDVDRKRAPSRPAMRPSRPPDAPQKAVTP